jgi:hypothetical protein
MRVRRLKRVMYTRRRVVSILQRIQVVRDIALLAPQLSEISVHPDRVVGGSGWDSRREIGSATIRRCVTKANRSSGVSHHVGPRQSLLVADLGNANLPGNYASEPYPISISRPTELPGFPAYLVLYRRMGRVGSEMLVPRAPPD